MKILVATAGHRPDDDRIYYKEIVTLLAAGHEVTLVTRAQQPFDPGKAGFSHVDFVPGRLGSFGRAVEELAAVWRPDIMMIHEFELLLAGSRIRKKWGTPLVYDVHEAHLELWDLLSSRRYPVKQIINWGLYRFERSLLKNVDRVLTVSPPLKTRYERWGRPTTLVPNFPRLGIRIPSKPREPVVIYAGQLSIERGLMQLIQAFVGVLDERPDARLELIGPERLPGLHEKLRTDVVKMGLEKSVTIEGEVSQAAILQRLTEVQVGVIPFIDHPVFHIAIPIKLFEYMLCGCAVVTSDLKMIRQYAGEAAVFVPPGDVDGLRQMLISLLRDDTRREDLARRGRELVETRYNWQQVESALLNTLEALG
ncbi:MAG: glycosyltransferase family 4 protein [Candidatus Marinimicrobia bacterium]|nr:glycosyltransferase family 4 protein [Candidatus Neomarinimicrobiota bacterium]